jgi:hypothetical protein
MSMRLVCGWVAAAAVCVGCSASPEEPDGANVQVTSACVPARAVVGGPVAGEGGPYFHQVVIAHTTDGLTLSGAHQVLDHASVPDGVRRADGTVVLYYVNGLDGGITTARVQGDTAVVTGPITINGVLNPSGVVDPDVTLMPDGSIRLAYFGGFGAPTATNPRAMCIADAADGMHFTVRSTALQFENSEMLTDPSLLQLGDGSWLMAISAGQRTLIARSPAGDGLRFTRETTFDLGGVPELARAPDGAVRVYACAAGIVSYRSLDGGRSWTRERTVAGPGFGDKRIVCDPSLVPGAGLFVFKTG